MPQKVLKTRLRFLKFWPKGPKSHTEICSLVAWQPVTLQFVMVDAVISYSNIRLRTPCQLRWLLYSPKISDDFLSGVLFTNARHSGWCDVYRVAGFDRCFHSVYWMTDSVTPIKMSHLSTRTWPAYRSREFPPKDFNVWLQNTGFRCVPTKYTKK